MLFVFQIIRYNKGLCGTTLDCSLCYAAMNLLDNLQVESEWNHSFISQTETLANARQFWGSHKLENVSINASAKKKKIEKASSVMET